MQTRVPHPEIPLDERLIFPLDGVTDVAQAIEWVDRLEDAVTFYKIGSVLVVPWGSYDLSERLKNKGKKIMLDLKLIDVPETMSATMAQVKDWTTYATLMAHGVNGAMFKAANSTKNATKTLAVTVLTSLDENDLRETGIDLSMEELVLRNARRAIEEGCDGLVCAGTDAPMLRRELGDDFLIVSPGVRFEENNVQDDDQKRVATVSEAFENGVDHVIVGRPIRNSDDPKAAALRIRDMAREVLGG